LIAVMRGARSRAAFPPFSSASFRGPHGPQWDFLHARPGAQRSDAREFVVTIQIGIQKICHQRTHTDQNRKREIKIVNLKYCGWVEFQVFS